MSGVGRLVGGAGLAASGATRDLNLTSCLQVVDGHMGLIFGHAGCARNLGRCLCAILEGFQSCVVVLLRHLVVTLHRYRVVSTVAET